MTRQEQFCPKCRMSVKPAYFRAPASLGNKFMVITKPSNDEFSYVKDLHGFWCRHCGELVWLKVHDVHRVRYSP